MSLAVCLLLYSFAVAVLAPSVLTGLTRGGAMPRVGVAAWLAAIGTVLASWLGAAAAVVVELIGARAVPASVLMRSCLGLLRAVAAGAYGQPVRLAVVTVTAAAVAAAGVLAWRLGRAMWRARRATHHHAQLALLTPRRLTPVTATTRPHRVNRTRRISTVVLET
ncbi:MAG TPA: hypothetical protein VGH89_13280, partial [Pseudonocardia sp.]